MGGKSSCGGDCDVFWIDLLPFLGNWTKSHHGTYNTHWRFIDDWWLDDDWIHFFFLLDCLGTTLIVQGRDRLESGGWRLTNSPFSPSELWSHRKEDDSLIANVIRDFIEYKRQ